MKTILHIAKYYYPYNGGIEAVTRQLVEGLSDYRNIVICYSSDRETVEELINGVKVYRVGVQGTILTLWVPLFSKSVTVSDAPHTVTVSPMSGGVADAAATIVSVPVMSVS